MYCKKCGKIMGDEDRFCGYCGTMVDSKTEEKKPTEELFWKTEESEKATEAESRKHERVSFDWNLDGFPSGEQKRTDTVDFNWNSVIDERDRERYNSFFGKGEEKTEVGMDFSQEEPEEAASESEEQSKEVSGTEIKGESLIDLILGRNTDAEDHTTVNQTDNLQPQELSDESEQHEMDVPSLEETIYKEAGAKIKLTEDYPSIAQALDAEMEQLSAKAAQNEAETEAETESESETETETETDLPTVSMEEYEVDIDMPELKFGDSEEEATPEEEASSAEDVPEESTLEEALEEAEETVEEQEQETEQESEPELESELSEAPTQQPETDADKQVQEETPETTDETPEQKAETAHTDTDLPEISMEEYEVEMEVPKLIFGTPEEQEEPEEKEFSEDVAEESEDIINVTDISDLDPEDIMKDYITSTLNLTEGEASETENSPSNDAEINPEEKEEVSPKSENSEQPILAESEEEKKAHRLERATLYYKMELLKKLLELENGDISEEELLSHYNEE